MVITRFYSTPILSEYKREEINQKLKKVHEKVSHFLCEICYHVESVAKLTKSEIENITWLLSPVLNHDWVRTSSMFRVVEDNECVIECGPRFNFSTPYSSNAVQICKNIGIKSVNRFETSKRYLITLSEGITCWPELEDKFGEVLYDKMTHCIYNELNLPSKSFDECLEERDPWYFVRVLEDGRRALEEVNDELGLAFDNWDLDYYTDLFVNTIQKNPTSVECFDLAQSNSEHSRHWFFKGRLVVNGVERPKSLIDMIMNTQKTSIKNNVIKFSDNSSAIIGFPHQMLMVSGTGGPRKVESKNVGTSIIFTAETHNMPTAVSPFSGATTGTGGRIRDIQAVGRGGISIAGTAGYCVGNLRLPDLDTPWEDKNWNYPKNFASPLDILIEASNGASDYGNKFGEPVINGFVISYGLRINNERREYVKPVMFSGGIGYMLDTMVRKSRPEKGHLVVKLGGPVYRIGVGGGAASSVAVQGENGRSAALDFGAVQRGDAEMENRLNRVIRACVETAVNPILSIHDQGAGGNGNVLKELVEPQGAMIFTEDFILGDPTITTMELWGAEYQESNAILCKKENQKVLEDICKRERCPISIVGEVTGDGRVRLIEDSIKNIDKYKQDNETRHPFDLSLETVLGNMPRKEFHIICIEENSPEMSFKVSDLLDTLSKVLKLVSVGSKRYLTNKVDRCVTGLIAQQQCVGPLHTPLSDYGMVAFSYSNIVGAATSIGTQPIKGLVDPRAGARMAVGEALTNLVFAGISRLGEVKCSGNWMWSGKTGREGGRLLMACEAMCEIMTELEIAIDGGKDSLSMSAAIGNERVKSPGTLVISTYAPVPNVYCKLQPCFKEEGSHVVWVPICPGKYRLGGSAVCQVFGQLGNTCPDVDNPQYLKEVFEVVQTLIKEGKLLSGHDISDGGLITCFLEMAFGGLIGVSIDLGESQNDCIELLFSEELGLVLEVNSSCYDYCVKIFTEHSIKTRHIGFTTKKGMKAPVKIIYNTTVILEEELHVLFREWEEISYRLELLQANPECVEEEWKYLHERTGPKYVVNFDPEQVWTRCTVPIRVAVIREEGTNGDREMMAALMKSRFEVYDVTMSDLLHAKTTLNRFQGVVFPGGFSYGDTLGSAKGWAANIICNEYMFNMFNNFARRRKNTFSLGVCNGCQLMPLIGWIRPESFEAEKTWSRSKIALDRNKSERFECRWSSVLINSGRGANVWFKGMEFSVLGVWVAHGEGRFAFEDDRVLESLVDNGQICMQYVDDAGNYTERYPMNPNGSPLGIAGLCSEDGRHVGLMPHPERCVLEYQCPDTMRRTASMITPWQKMFDNAYDWAVAHFEC